MSLSSAFASVEAANQDLVFRETWGHCAPKKNKSYPVKFAFSIAEYGGSIDIIQANTGALPDSPWLYDAMTDFAGDNGERGEVRRFVGVFRNYKFVGTVETINLGIE